MPEIEEVSSDPLVKHSTVNHPLVKQTSDQIVDEPIRQTTVSKLLIKQSTTGDPLGGQHEVDKPMDTDILDENAVTDDRLAVKPTVNEQRDDQSNPSADNPMVEQNTVDEAMDCDILGEKSVTGVRMGAQPNVKVEPTVGSDSTATIDNAVKPTVNEIKVEKTSSINPYNPQAEKPTVNNLLTKLPSVIKRIDSNLLYEHGTKDDPLIVRPAVIKPKVEKNTNSNPIGQPCYQTTTNEPETEQTENVLLTDQRKVTEKRTVSDLSSAVKTANIDLSAMKSTFNHPKTDGPMDNELLNRSITKDDPLVSSVQLASRAVGLNIADTHDRPGMSSELKHRAEDMSSM